MTLYNLSGTNLGQYELRELIGAGRMGAVYHAFQPNLRREVAIRVLPPSSYSKRFAYLAEIAASLEHPHIVRVYDYGTEQDTNYLVMQFMTGGSLTERLAQQALPSLGEITSLLQQISSALIYAHERSIIHQNVNPSNVMFHDNGLACLTDFGFSQLINRPGYNTRSWGYLSPEQWNNEQLTPATDQYSLAVMIYYLIMGRLPFAGATPSAIMFKHLYDMPPPLPNTPDTVTAVLEQALAKRAEDRFPTVAAFAEAFTGAVGNETGMPTGFFSAPFERKPVPEIVTPTLPAAPAYPRIPPVANTTPLHKNPLFWVIAATVLTVMLIGAVRREADNKNVEAGSAVVSVSENIEETPSGGITSNNNSANPVVLATETQPALLPTSTVSPTVTPSATPLPPSNTPTAQPSATPLPPSATPLPPSATPVPTDTPTAVPTASNTPLPSATPLPPSNTPTARPSATPLPPSATPLPPSSTPVPTGTPTMMPTASNTPSPTNTATILPTNTTVPTTTATAPALSAPTSTLTLTPSYTPTLLPTLEPCNLADVNSDNLVDILDIRAISAHYGTTSSDPTFEELYDLDQDGVIGILDVQTAVAQFGAVCEP